MNLPIGDVITFSEMENRVNVTISETNPDHYIGHETSFASKGKVIGVERDFLVVKLEEHVLRLGQGRQISIAN